MLILIVVAAAVALAAFVAGYESQYLSEQAAAHNKALENLQIISLSPIVNATAGADNYSNISVVIGSLDVQNTTVKEITLNGLPVAFFEVGPLGSSGRIPVCLLCVNTTTYGGVAVQPDFQLAADEQANISFNLLTWNGGGRFWGGMFTPYDLVYDHYVTIGIYTLLGNDFTRSFYPPTAVVLTEQSEDYIDGTETPTVVLDGTHTIPPTNSTIVSWSWSIYPNLVATNGPPEMLSGEEQLIPQAEFNTSVSYTISLTVTTADGLVGAATVCYGASDPCAPTGLVITGETASTISISWSFPPGLDPDPPLTGCTVDWGASPSLGTMTPCSSPSATSFEATGLAASTSYYFAVSVANGAGSSPSSVTVEGTTTT